MLLDVFRSIFNKVYRRVWSVVLGRGVLYREGGVLLTGCGG